MGFSVKDKWKAIRDRRQITLVTLNGFCPLNKTPLHHPHPHPLLLKDNIKLDRIPSQIKWKIMHFSHCISSFEGTSYKKLQVTADTSFYISRYNFLKHFRSLLNSLFESLFKLKTVCKRSVFLQFCDQIQSIIHQIHPNAFNSFYRTVTHVHDFNRPQLRLSAPRQHHLPTEN